MTIDLNCDMGEGMPNDALIMPYITSANIACGYHAGDIDTMHRTIELALQYNIAIGAHPSFDDKENFGRTEMHVDQNELLDIVSKQILTLKNISEELKAKLHHVKPHGALYNMAAKDAAISQVIVNAIIDIDPQLVLYGLSNSHLISTAKKMGLRTASEVFADRTYTDEGLLTPRSKAGAMIEDEERSLQQVMRMVKEKNVVASSGKIITIEADTICIHGDGKHAVSFAKNIHNALKQNQVDLKAI